MKSESLSMMNHGNFADDTDIGVIAHGGGSTPLIMGCACVKAKISHEMSKNDF
jgi:hypothetical protein